MKTPLVSSFVFLLCITAWSAENVKSHAKISQESSVTSNHRMLASYPQSDKPIHPFEPGAYPLFRPHSSKYYPPKNTRQAIVLSAALPGLGQVYGGRPGKGFTFLIAEFGLLAFAGFNLDRAVHYNDLADRFTTGFFDPHNIETFLTADQGHVKSRGHARLGTIFLATGIGVHIWNIFDAAETVKEYNNRRFPAQVQQTSDGATYLTLTHRF